MIYIGIDWSKDHHDMCIMSESGAVVSQIKYKQSLEGYQRMEAECQKLGVPPRQCIVAIETTYNLMVDFLVERGYMVYIIPPQATKGYRNRKHSSNAHTDASDAALLASIMRTDRDSHRRLLPNSPLTQQILAQVRLIELLRCSIQRQENQLGAVLLRIYPQALGLFDKLSSQISLHFLAAYPTARKATALSLEDFREFCTAHHYTHPSYIPIRYAHLIEPAPAANKDVIQAYQGHVSTLAELLLPQVKCKIKAQIRLTKLFDQHPDAFIFDSLPGAGKLLAPALLAKFGDQRGRFPNHSDVQALAGTCPTTECSGRRRTVRFRRGCDKEFRRITQQYARSSARESGWANAYCREIRSHHPSISHAYRCLANRWLAIIWKIWQTRQAYDEGYHLRQRAARRRPRS